MMIRSSEAHAADLGIVVRIKADASVLLPDEPRAGAAGCFDCKRRKVFRWRHYGAMRAGVLPVSGARTTGRGG